MGGVQFVSAHMAPSRIVHWEVDPRSDVAVRVPVARSGSELSIHPVTWLSIHPLTGSVLWQVDLCVQRSGSSQGQAEEATAVHCHNVHREGGGGVACLHGPRYSSQTFTFILFLGCRHEQGSADLTSTQQHFSRRELNTR